MSEADRIEHLTKCLKLALLIIQNESSAAEISRRSDKAARLARFVEEIKAEASIKDLTI